MVTALRSYRPHGERDAESRRNVINDVGYAFRLEPYTQYYVIDPEHFTVDLAGDLRVETNESIGSQTLVHP